MVGYADITPVNERTTAVQNSIVAAVSGIDNANDITNTHLASITTLNLRNKGITILQSGDFSGLIGLTNLNLYNNQLSSLPDGIFKGLTALTTLRLGKNAVDPLLLTVLLEKVGDNQLKSVIPTGAPFDIVVPFSITNGSISGGTTTLTITKGSTESGTVTFSRTADTTDAVIANIGTLPSLPTNHYGYLLSKSDSLPLEVIAEVSTTDVTPTPDTTPNDTNIPPNENEAPVFTDGNITVRSIAENSTADTNIGLAISATDANNNTLTYTLSNTDAVTFNIDSTTGQLKTKAALDYETKRIYIITVSVSDGSLTATIYVIISIIDVADTSIISSTFPVSDRTPAVRDAIVASVPNINDAANITNTHLSSITTLNLRDAGITALKTGDFAGLTALTNLNLYGNLLNKMPNGIFTGLTALTSLRLGGNTSDPMILTVAIQQVRSGEFRAVIPTGTPFDVVLPINGNMITIPKGNISSESFMSASLPNLGTLPTRPSDHYGYILAESAVCNRTQQVSDSIVAALSNISDCSNVTEVDLATITTLDLSDSSITSLISNDLQGIPLLTSLDLSNNQLSVLPNHLFKGLSSLQTLDLSNNTVSPLPISVVLQKVGSDQFKVVMPPGSPFNLELPINVTNGSVEGNVENVTLPIGKVESTLFTVTRSPNTFEAVTVEIGILPDIPVTHLGYTIIKSDALEIFEPINIAPVFTENSPATRMIAENTDAGTNIGDAFEATDANNDTLTYTLGGTDAGTFDIDTTTGQLQTKAALDYETESTYTVIVTVSDGSLTDTIRITIQITDVDENRAPLFTEDDPATRTIAENTEAGVNIGNPVSATDLDNDTLTYSLSGTDAESFDIVSTSGQLQTKASLDYETDSSYTVKVKVSDGKLTDTITVTISVTNIDEKPTPPVVSDDNSQQTSQDDPPTTKSDSPTTVVKDTPPPPNNTPVFTEGNSASRSIPENTGSGVNIGSPVSATDSDKDTLTYSLSGTDASSFSIDSSSGQLRTSASLDYDIKNSYMVMVNVSDSKGGSDSIVITIEIIEVDETVPNNAPVFASESTTRKVAENSVENTNIGAAITATDDDNDTLTYQLAGTDAASFSIENTTGQLKTKSELNHEDKSSYTVTVSVSDDKGGTDNIIVTISVSDVNEAPSFPTTNTTRNVAERTAAGINIGAAVTATDPDADASLTYTLSGTDAVSFDIDNKTGQLKTKAALNYDIKNNYTVTIVVSDGILTDSITVTIRVINLDETPSNNPPEFTEGETTTRSIPENTASGTNIGQPITATDADENTLAYTLSGDDASAFSIDINTGQIKTNAGLNYESKDTYQVTCTVNDGSSTDIINVTIEVTDVNEAPVFAEESIPFSIAENTAAATNIGDAITATDPDEDVLTYTLGGTGAASFDIDENTGQLKTKAALDFETLPNTYSLSVIATDEGNLSDSIEVTITVTDINENRAPVFDENDSTERSVAENTGSGVDIGEPVSASDPDNDTLTYTLGGSDAASFDIDSTTGQLRTKATLDFETSPNTYSVTVTVSDGKLTDTITVTIKVTDVSENRPPMFSSPNTTRNIAENTSAGEDIGSAITADDPDNDDLTYTLSGTDAASFDIDRNTGQLKTKVALDYETKDSYSVIVTASDGEESDMITVTINVTNVTSGFSITETTPISRSVAENTASGVAIGEPVSVHNEGGSLSFRIDESTFAIDSSSGQLKTKAALDHETKDSYRIIIWISNRRRSTAAPVDITVTDVNEAPEFDDGDSTSRNVDENTAANTDFGSPVAATDVDDGDTITYTLGGTDMASFVIDSSTGQLKTKAALNFETKSEYSVTITATDDELTDTINVTINVKNVIENALLSTRTTKVAREIVSELDKAETDITAADLAGLERLSFFDQKIGSVKNGDFSGLTSLKELNLGHNGIHSFPEDVFDGLSNLEVLFIDYNPFTSLPEKIFDGLSSLEKLWIEGSNMTSIPADLFDGLSSLKYLVAGRSLHTSLPDGLFEGLTSLMAVQVHSNAQDTEGNYVGYFDLTVELKRVSSGKIKTSIRTGAPFSIEVPLTVTNGSLSGGVTSITIPVGKIESDAITVTRTSGTTAAVMVDMGDLPAIPTYGPHTGYNLVKPTNLPLTVIDVGGAPAQYLPNTTALLPNFPNPFNPETWIPYQLAKSSDVSMTIFSVRGVVVRQIVLKQQTAGFYRTRSRAVHWDGRNMFGEKVACGVYFYVFKAGDYSATRKMLIVK